MINAKKSNNDQFNMAFDDTARLNYEESLKNSKEKPEEKVFNVKWLQGALSYAGSVEDVSTLLNTIIKELQVGFQPTLYLIGPISDRQSSFLLVGGLPI